MIFDPSIELLVHMCFVQADERREARSAFAAIYLHKAQRAFANDPPVPLFVGLEAAALKLRAKVNRRGAASVGEPAIEVKLSGPQFAMLRAKQVISKNGGLQSVAEGRSLTDLINMIDYAMTSDGRTVGMVMLTLARIHCHKSSWASVRRTMDLLAEQKKSGVARHPNARDAEFGTRRNQNLAWSRFKGVAPLWAGLLSATFGQRPITEVAAADFVHKIFDQLSEQKARNIVLEHASWFADFATKCKPLHATEAVLPLLEIDFFCTVPRPLKPILEPLSEFEIKFLTNYTADPN